MSVWTQSTQLDCKPGVLIHVRSTIPNIAPWGHLRGFSSRTIKEFSRQSGQLSGACRSDDWSDMGWAGGQPNLGVDSYFRAAAEIVANELRSRASQPTPSGLRRRQAIEAQAHTDSISSERLPSVIIDRASPIETADLEIAGKPRSLVSGEYWQLKSATSHIYGIGRERRLTHASLRK